MLNSLSNEIESLCFLVQNNPKEQDGQGEQNGQEVQNGQEEQDNKRIPLWPYVVAVTGHRSFAKPDEDEDLTRCKIETIKNAFRKELEDLARLWKKSCKGVNAPLILLTGMAEGADQLAAEVALEEKFKYELNVKVVAVLPMQKELFKLTLSKEKQDRLENLLKDVHMTYGLSLPKSSSDKEEDKENEFEKYSSMLADVNKPETKKLLNNQYDMLCKFLALHSHVLFAFWDGQDASTDPYDRTTKALHFKLEGNTEQQLESDMLTYTSVGPVVQFYIPRDNDENQKEPDEKQEEPKEPDEKLEEPKEPDEKLEEPKKIAVFYWSRHDMWDAEENSYFFPSREQMIEEYQCKTSVSSMKEIVDTLKRIGELNWYSINCPEDVKEKLSTPNVYPFKQKYLDKIQSKSDDFCDAETKALIEHFTYADQLAVWFQAQMQSKIYYFLWGVGLFLLFGSLISSFWEIYQNHWGTILFSIFFPSEKNTLIETFYTWTLFIILTLFYWFAIIKFIRVYQLSNREQYRIRFYRFRAVAEALRVQIFWRIAEMSNCVSGHYRNHQLHETEWLRTAINGLDVLFDSPTKENFNKTRKERLTFVREVWINEQLKYFKSKLIKGEEAHSFDQLDFMKHFWKLIKCVEQFLEKYTVKNPFLWFWLFLICVVPIRPLILYWVHDKFGCLAIFLQILYGLLLIIIPIGGLIKFWVNAKTPQSDLDRYKQMMFPFDRATLLLKPELEKEDIEKLLEADSETESGNKTKSKLEQLQTILRQLGTEAVSENAAWYLSFGERELTLPR